MTLRNLPKSRFARNLTKREMAKIAEDAPLAEKLFHHKFQLYVPAAYMYTEEDFARGVIVSGDKQRDAQSANEIAVAYLPIAPDDDNPGQLSILKLFEEEIPCTFRYEAEVTKVYNILMEHFQKMAEYIGANPLMNPEKRARIIEDLRRFDVLAAKLHPNAHVLMPQHLKADSLENRLRMFLRPTLATQETKEAEAESAAAPIPEYKSFEVGLSPSLLKGNKRWQ